MDGIPLTQRNSFTHMGITIMVIPKMSLCLLKISSWSLMPIHLTSLQGFNLILSFIIYLVCLLDKYKKVYVVMLVQFNPKLHWGLRRSPPPRKQICRAPRVPPRRFSTFVVVEVLRIFCHHICENRTFHLLGVNQQIFNFFLQSQSDFFSL